MAVPLAIPIATTVGEFAAPYLIRKAGKLGIKKFIETYGSTAWQSIAGVTGGMIAQLTEPVDLQTEKILGMPVSRITGQGEVYSDIDEDKEKQIPTKVTEGEPTTPTEPEPPEDPDVGADLAAEAAIHTTKKLLEDKKTKDIAKQTEELVSGTEEDFTEGLKEYEEVYSPERFKKANDKYPELSPANNKKIVEADKHFGAIALARIYGHNSNETQLIYLSPQEYLDLTKQFGRIDGTWSPGGKAIIKYLEGKIKDGKEIGEIPILFVSKQGENYLVNGQEGRHRAQAFKNQGYNKIPVRIEGSGKNKESGVENKVYTATKRSYLYTEDWTQDYIGFIPKNIISKSDYNKDTEQYESWESKSVKPGDFYDVASKKKLFVKEDTLPGIGHNQPPSSIEEQTDDLVTKTKPKEYKGELTEVKVLDKNLMDFIAKYAGTPQEMRESIKLPQSHQKKIYIQLGKYLEKNYPTKLTKKDMEHEDEALFYMASVLYSAYYRQDGKVPNNMIVIADDIGIPMAVAEIEVRADQGKRTYYPKRKKGSRSVIHEPAIYIEMMGSLNAKATEKIMEAVEKLADINDIRYVVAEDLTSELALRAIQLRGFKPAKKGFFEGDIIATAKWRGGREVKQKNMVLDLGEKYATTQEEINKEFEKERIQEQTEKLTKK